MKKLLQLCHAFLPFHAGDSFWFHSRDFPLFWLCKPKFKHFLGNLLGKLCCDLPCYSLILPLVVVELSDCIWIKPNWDPVLVWFHLVPSNIPELQRCLVIFACSCWCLRWFLAAFTCAGLWCLGRFLVFCWLCRCWCILAWICWLACFCVFYGFLVLVHCFNHLLCQLLSQDFCFLLLCKAPLVLLQHALQLQVVFWPSYGRFQNCHCLVHSDLGSICVLVPVFVRVDDSTGSFVCCSQCLSRAAMQNEKPLQQNTYSMYTFPQGFISYKTNLTKQPIIAQLNYAVAHAPNLVGIIHRSRQLKHRHTPQPNFAKPNRFTIGNLVADATQNEKPL